MVPRNFIIASIVILIIFSAGFYYFYSKLYKSGTWSWGINNSNLTPEEQRSASMYKTLAKLKTASPEFNEKKVIETLNLLRGNTATTSAENMLKKLNELKTDIPTSL